MEKLNMTEIQEGTKTKAFLTAERIAAAINKKFPNYIHFVRRIETGEFAFYEIALRPKNGSHNDEVTSAYSEPWFEEVDDSNLRERALRILKDFRIHMGLPHEG
jgi:hypothetical protein